MSHRMARVPVPPLREACEKSSQRAHSGPLAASERAVLNWGSNDEQGVEMKKLRRPVALAASGTALVLAGSALGAGVYSVSTSPRTTTVVRQAAPAATAVPTSQTQASALNVHQIYTRNAPGVVQITVTEQGQAGPYPFGGGSSQAQGSGFVYDSKGDIVTNEHVVAGATSIRVTFSDGSSYPAKLVGRD